TTAHCAPWQRAGAVPDPALYENGAHPFPACSLGARHADTKTVNGILGRAVDLFCPYGAGVKLSLNVGTFIQSDGHGPSCVTALKGTCCLLPKQPHRSEP